MLRYIFIVVIGAACYGLLSTFVVKAYGAGFIVNEVVGSQILYGFAMLLALGGLMRRRGLLTDLRSVTLRTAGLAISLGICLGATSVLYYGALQYVPASLAITLLFQFTWIGVVLEAVLDRKLPSRLKAAALLIIFIGTLFAAGLIGESGTHFSMTGIALGLLAALSYAIFIVLSGRTAPDMSPYTRSLMISAVSVVLIVIVFPPVFLTNGTWYGQLSVWGLLLAFFGIVVPTVCFAIGVPKIGGGLASILSSVELPVAVLMSSFVLHEDVTGLKWLGVLIILAGVCLPELLRNKRLWTSDGQQ